MIVFGTAVTDPNVYDRYAAEGIRRTAEPDSVVFAHQSAGSVFRNYNVLLDKARAYDDLEGLVLVHQDAELVDSDFIPKLRKALSDPEVAIVGCAGSVGVRSIAWWQGALTWAGLTHRYPEWGGGDFPAISWRPEAVPSYASTGEVDSIDGFVMVLSPWAVRELRFDESLGKLHGYDFDICMQARAAGKKVVTANFRAIHHHSLELIKDPENWIQTHMRLAEKWDGQLPDTGAEPRRRALRAEAEAACATAIRVAHQMRAEAITRYLARVQRELDRTREELKTTKQELAAVRRGPRTTAVAPDASPSRPPLSPGKLQGIDYAVDELGVESFASLEFGPTYGQAAFYTIDKPTVETGALIDVGFRRPRDHLLSVIEQAAERPGLRVLEGGFADPRTVSEIGEVDAILLVDVLLRMVDPDWGRVLELYAPATSCFVIANPQWERGESAIRLIDLGREKYLDAVPPWLPHIELFDRKDDWLESQGQPYRDCTAVWQWGITDAALRARMDELGFSLVRERSLSPPPKTKGFLNKTFVFSRSGP
jgi:Glycosyltransferase like family